MLTFIVQSITEQGLVKAKTKFGSPTALQPPYEQSRFRRIDLTRPIQSDDVYIGVDNFGPESLWYEQLLELETVSDAGEAFGYELRPDGAYPTHTISIKLESFRITDRAVALQPGNVFRKAGQAWELAQFADGSVPPGQADCLVHIDRNPYNFVRFAPDSGPWLDAPPAVPQTPASGETPPPAKHAGHARWHSDLLHGTLCFTLTPETPLFTPMGEVGSAADGEADDRKRNRHFFRLRRHGEEFHRYAIPGSSLKGVLRSLVEAAANDRLGVFNKNDYDQPIPYRRRAFDMGRVSAVTPEEWQVQPMHAVPGSTLAPDPNQELFLLHRVAATPHLARPMEVDTGARPLTLLESAPNGVAPGKLYRDNLQHEHGHYERHYQNALKLDQHVEELQAKIDDPATAPSERRAATEERDLLVKRQYQSLPQDGGAPLTGDRFRNQIIAPLKLADGDQIYFTRNGGTITSFGKNVNYLWPAAHSVADLAGEYKPKTELGLGDALGLAERLFGFSGKHVKEKSHPFRGKVVVKNAWGPRAEDQDQEESWNEVPKPLPDGEGEGLEIKLAPLTSPATHAKSRPLYLQPRADGTSASYSDPNPKLRGRKLYYKQRGGDPLWGKHRLNAAAHAKVQKQCPPPMLALRNAVFEAELQFDNLSKAELGALLFVLTGGGGSVYRLQLGQGKPRQMGICRVGEGWVARGERASRPLLERFQPELRYRSLVAAAAAGDAIDGQACLAAFYTWAAGHAAPATVPAIEGEAAQAAFFALPHIQDFLALQRLPAEDSVRYYPPNFSQYTWLPKEKHDPDEPKGVRPLAMRMASECGDAPVVAPDLDATPLPETRG